MAFKLNEIPNASQETSILGDIEKLLKKEIILFDKGFSNKKKQAFYMELAVLLKAGITIKESLVLVTASAKKKDKDMLEQVLQKVVNGLPFSQALFETKQFSEYEYHSLRIGEETGTTSRVCQELGTFYTRKNEQRRIVLAALTYPAIVLSTAVFVVLFMLNYVVPMFQDIFKQNKMELPFITRMIVKASAFTQSYGWLLILLIIAIILSARLLKDNPVYTKNIHYLLMKIPVMGPFMIKVNLAQFTQAVTLLTASKVPILNSIQIVTKMIRFVPLKDALEKVEGKILQGYSLSESMQGNPIFDTRILSLIKVAEETNQTEYVFTQLNEQYSQEVLQQSKMMSTVLEPFIILFVGVLVAILLVAMYLPMFQLSSVIG